MYEILSQAAARVGGITFAAGPGVAVVAARQNDVRLAGVRLTFPNGFVLTFKWGSENACDGWGNLHGDVFVTAEVTVWDHAGRLVSDVLTYVPADEALSLIPHVMGLSPDVQHVKLNALLPA